MPPSKKACQTSSIYTFVMLAPLWHSPCSCQASFRLIFLHFCWALTLCTAPLGLCRHPDCVEYLVTNGADPLLTDERRRNTCLHFASLYGHSECVHKLLGSRAAYRAQVGDDEVVRSSVVCWCMDLESEGHRGTNCSLALLTA